MSPNRFPALVLLLLLTASLAAAQAPSGAVSGLVQDPTGAVIPSATVRIDRGSVAVATVTTNAEGRFTFTALPAGRYRVSAWRNDFARQNREVIVKTAATSTVDLSLQPAGFAEEVTVLGPTIIGPDEVADRIPGSVSLIDETTLASSHVRDFSEALRKAPGVTVRDEEGFGLRPNIGIRGLNPTRSSKVLLLEDGIPLAYAPYGDNASYYHPPVERFSMIEVLKGSGQILYGPSTVGGVVNYITPEAPQDFGGSLSLNGGTRSYFNGEATLGGTWKQTGILLDFMRKQGQGSRENIHSKLNDVGLKISRAFAKRHTFTLKGNLYQEDSNVTYSGLRLAEYQADPRQNPFRNDVFQTSRHGVSLHHTVALNSRFLLSTNLYGSVFTRDWWRQSSNSGQRPNDSADPVCAGMANLNTACGNEGRLRQYHTAGIEPHLRADHRLFGVRSELDLGFRAHFEKQYRHQRNGALPTSREGTLVENNIRRTQAYSTFIQNKFNFGRVVFTPGVRVEHVDYSRTNLLANGGAGVKGKTSLTQAVPGFGIAVAAGKQLTLFGGVHRGFAPPRAEDIVSNTGGTIELDPELSWNYEAGVRANPRKGLRADVTYFRMDYENQLVPASLAGGIGAALTNGGQTLHQGLEVSGRIDTGIIKGWRHNIYLTGAYTYLPTARFEGTRFSNIGGFSSVSVSGNRLPYAPRNTFNGSFGFVHSSGMELMLEGVYIGNQFGDDLNTIASSSDGQRGLLPGNTTWNAVVNYPVEHLHATFFIAVKNLADATHIVDRSRGILPNNPRTVQTGFRYRW
ncbi:MAG: TonB-dependent receptor [Terriglobales bacterium]